MGITTHRDPKDSVHFHPIRLRVGVRTDRQAIRNVETCRTYATVRRSIIDVEMVGRTYIVVPVDSGGKHKSLLLTFA